MSQCPICHPSPSPPPCPSCTACKPCEIKPCEEKPCVCPQNVATRGVPGNAIMCACVYSVHINTLHICAHSLTSLAHTFDSHSLLVLFLIDNHPLSNTHKFCLSILCLTLAHSPKFVSPSHHLISSAHISSLHFSSPPAL